MKHASVPTHVKLGWLAAVLAVGAVVTDVVAPVAGARSVVWITPIELARQIRENGPDLDLVDVRAPAAYEAGHIPTARNSPLDQFDGTAVSQAATMVVYGDDDGDAIEAMARAGQAGLGNRVRVLERGLDGWLDDIMAPALRRDATDGERAAFAARSELSRWFGGVPRIVDSTDPAGDSPERSARLLGGC